MELSDVWPYLMDRGLLGPRAVVDGNLTVDDVSGRNRVFLASAERERSLVLKAATEADDSGVAHEADVLRCLHSASGRRRLAAYLPAVVWYDSAVGVLVLESAPGAEDLARYHARGHFSLTLAREAGRALASLHEVPVAAVDNLRGAADPVWTIFVDPPSLSILPTLSGGSVELLRTVQRSDELCTALNELNAPSRVRSIVHGDVRWDNCLALKSVSSNRRTRVQLIDWELSGAGDPAMDVGAFLGEYMRAWVRSVPVVEPREPGRLVKNARLPLSRMQPAVNAFLHAYARQRGLSAAELSRTTRRATRFGAARLLAAGLEEAQTLPALGGSVLLTVQLSLNVLRRPDEAAAHLLGVSALWATS